MPFYTPDTYKIMNMYANNAMQNNNYLSVYRKCRVEVFYVK